MRVIMRRFTSLRFFLMLNFAFCFSANAHAQQTATSLANGDQSIRPFRVHVPDEEIVDLRKRLAATRWPDQETVSDQSQGAQLARLQELVKYWGTSYDWRKAEA